MYEQSLLYSFNKIKCDLCKKHIYSLYEIKVCPECFTDIQDNSQKIIKSQIESPKTKSLIITKSFGVLDPISYTNQDILHVGISDSKGNIYNFWNTYKIDLTTSYNNIWKKVINIELYPDNSQYDDDCFDNHLLRNMKEQQKLFPNYNQFNNNCYDFVCRFLNCINYRDNKWTKESLAVFLIEFKIINLEKYCMIYKKINNLYDDKFMDNFYVEPAELSEFTYSICDSCNSRIIVGKRNGCLSCKDFDLCDECYVSIRHEHIMKNM